jgi:hypothetical protein
LKKNLKNTDRRVLAAGVTAKDELKLLGLWYHIRTFP